MPDDRNNDASPPDESSHHALWIGLAALVAVAVLFFGVRFLKGIPLGQDTYPLVLYLDNAEGLTEGAPVHVSGVQVGEVAVVRLDEDGPGVVARLQIQEDVELPRGSKASVEGLSALDNVHVAIERGAPSEEVLEAGARIPSAGPGTFEQLRQEALPLAARLDSIAYRASRIVGEAEEDLPPTFQNLRAFSADAEALLAGQQGRLAEVLDHLDQITGDLERVSSRLDTLTADVEGDSLELAVAQANRILRRLDGTARSVDRSAEHLAAILAQVESGEGTLGRLVYDPSLYTRLDSLTLRMNRVMADFEKNPGAFLNELTLVEVF